MDFFEIFAIGHQLSWLTFEDKSRRLVATNLFSKEDYLLLWDWWKIWRLYWSAHAKINRIPTKWRFLLKNIILQSLAWIKHCFLFIFYSSNTFVNIWKKLFCFSLSNQNLAHLSAVTALTNEVKLWKFHCKRWLVKFKKTWNFNQLKIEVRLKKDKSSCENVSYCYDWK